MDYEAIDLTPVVNADDDIEAQGVEVWRGKSVLRGLPFVFAERDGEPRLLRVAPGKSATVQTVGTCCDRSGSRACRARNEHVRPVLAGAAYVPRSPLPAAP